MLSIFFCPLRLTEVEPHFLNHGEEDKHFEVTSSIDSNINLWHPNTTMTTGPLLLLFQSKQQPEFETHQAKASQPCLSQILVESTLDQRKYTSYATYLPIIIYIYVDMICVSVWCKNENPKRQIGQIIDFIVSWIWYKLV